MSSKLTIPQQCHLCGKWFMSPTGVIKHLNKDHHNKNTSEQNTSPRDGKNSTSETADLTQLPVCPAEAPKNKLITPVDRLKTVTQRMKKPATIKRPVEIIDTPLDDPTIRKKRRTQHPINIMLGKRLQLICDKKEEKIPVCTSLSDTDSEDEFTNTTPQLNPPIIPNDVSNELNLSVSSDSSIEDGEISTTPPKPSPSNSSDNLLEIVKLEKRTCISDTSSDTSESSSSVISLDDKINPPSTNEKLPPCDTSDKRNVNFDLNANTVHEYVPDCKSTRAPPSYHPTPIQRTTRNPVRSIPHKDILFDLWMIIRKIDQELRKDLEEAMIKRGFLKPRFTR